MNGTVTDRFTYGTYGEQLSHTGKTDRPFRYNGEDGVMTDANGLYFMRARYYDPDIKRFINADTYKGELSNSATLNNFAYANGNPVTLTDPFGRCANIGHMVLDGLGMIPGFGVVFDGVNAIWYETEGDWVNAGLSGISIIPVIGEVCVAGKTAIKGIKYADEAAEFAIDAKNVEKLEADPYKLLRERGIPTTLTDEEIRAGNAADLRAQLKSGEGAEGAAKAEKIAWITPKSLPLEEEQAVENTLKYIDSGTKPSGSLAKKWGTTFGNKEGYLPPEGKYVEYKVTPPAGSTNAGTRRIVGNVETGELYYTWTHYGDTAKPAFVRIR